MLLGWSWRSPEAPSGAQAGGEGHLESVLATFASTHPVSLIRHFTVPEILWGDILNLRELMSVCALCSGYRQMCFRTYETLPPLLWELDGKELTS